MQSQKIKVWRCNSVQRPWVESPVLKREIIIFFDYYIWRNIIIVLKKVALPFPNYLLTLLKGKKNSLYWFIFYWYNNNNKKQNNQAWVLFKENRFIWLKILVAGGPQQNGTCHLGTSPHGRETKREPTTCRRGQAHGVISLHKDLLPWELTHCTRGASILSKDNAPIDLNNFHYFLNFLLPLSVSTVRTMISIYELLRGYIQIKSELWHRCFGLIPFQLWSRLNDR